jgi:uncharacterized protein (TIGR01777 family)
VKRSGSVIVTGATGLIGRALVGELRRRDYRVVAFVRDVDKARSTLAGASELVRYTLADSGGFEQAIEGTAAIVNLAGEPLFRPFTGRRTLRRATQERINGAQRLAQACARAKNPPHAFVQASSVGVYGFGPPAADVVAEDSAPLPGEHSEGSLAWERAARDNLPTSRVVLLRLGYVLAAEGGGLPYQLAQAAKGKVSFFRPGTQWLPWVHLADVVSFIVSAIEDAKWVGPYNLVAPEALTAAQFAEALSRATGARTPRLSPRFFAHLFMGAGAATVLDGRRVIPKRLLEQGYPFRYGELAAALRDLCERSP